MVKIILILVSIAIVVMVIVGVVRKKAAKKEMESNKEIEDIEEVAIKCKNILESYINDNEYIDYKKQLTNIHEEIRHSDVCNWCGIELDILEKLQDISKNKENLEEYLTSISSLIKERNIKIRDLK